ncbi:hypothetical protein PtrSN002B_002632 [Pyrenophora tritici-repentis]|nr:hypothetical protein PtrSN002B_002632 [Pyrenophora tritici-repentis]KAI1593700.1 hypothetical protein PtrEW13061_002862 [Pyrenophora tritici-repentis]PZD33368.1 Fork-head-N domain containing protein [Pyrenophora tritici-repentis]
MASTPPLSQPAAMRSPDKANVDLRHPVPDLQSLQGAYVGNIERLEEHAERMSETGSDLQEEIRKTYSELKLTDSRRSSLRSPHGDELTRQFSTRSRGLSNSSHANSIVDLNGNARWGGYSPGGYITSPVGSLRSGSWSNPPSSSIQRQRSGSKASRLGQVVHPEQVVEEEGNGHETHPASAPPASQDRDSASPPQRKVSSFTRIFDDVANGLPEDLRNSVIMGTPPRRQSADHHPGDNYQRHADHHDFPDRPPTAASTDTTHQVHSLWHDFDGVHCPDTVEEEPELSQLGRNLSRQSSNNLSFNMGSDPSLRLMSGPVSSHTQGQPPPDDGMVYYPAPVPRMLNLPKRLSQMPSGNQQARRRTQLLESMQMENRKSMPLPADPMDQSPKAARKSRASIMGLPPQLRASAYFDNRAAPVQEFAVKGDSAERMLESILDASAHAPVSAFTDHPFAGNVGHEVYGTEHKRMSSKLPEMPPTLQETRRRSSFNILDTKHNGNGERLKKLKKRNSSADMNLLLVKASETRMSLGDQLEERDEDARGPHNQHEDDATRPSYEEGHEGHPQEGSEEETSDEEEEVEEELQYGAPTTLLAELQLRQAKQKTRNMNYVTLMEQGLIDGRQTLLQMNDKAEAEKQRRIRKKVNLAWEAPGEDEDSDDDVPLGVLYKQPPRGPKIIGLIEQREMEDREPLSRRRNRLRGLDPNHRHMEQAGASSSQVNLGVPQMPTPDPISDEDEGETLADRMRRLKEKQQLEAALGDDIRNSHVSGDFAAEMMSKFGVTEDQNHAKDTPLESPKDSPKPGEEEEQEETLGQRRARLQAEAAARGELPPQGNTRPGLYGSTSLADILSANPIDPHNQARKVSNEALISHLPQGSLLRQNVMDQERKKQQRLNATKRASSYGTIDPLIKGVGDKEKDDDDIPLGQKIQAYKNSQNPMMNSQMGGGQGMMSMNGMGLMSQTSLNMSMQQPMMGGGGGGMGMMGMQSPMGMMQQPGMMGMPMGMQMPMGPMAGMGMNGMPMGMNMAMMQGGMMGPPMDPRQRDQIDQWMQGIRHS